VGEDDGQCRVVKLDGERCRAERMLAYGICSGHAGRGLAANPAEAQRRSKEVRARWKARRHLLGIGPSGRANPRALARLKALERSEELAEAILAPLDDPDLGTVQRHLSALRVVDAVFPLAEATVELEIPADPEAMGWADMQRLARLLSLDAHGVERIAIDAGER
jgi:hypothetical protein